MSKAKRLTALGAMLVLSAGLTGCSGINASHSVSPASFLLPGLIHHEPRPAPEALPVAPVDQLALLDVANR